MSSTPDALGVLGKLPFEVRNQIYDKLFFKCYTMPPMNIRFRDDEEDRTGIATIRKRIGYGTLGILYTSHALLEETRLVLYQQSRFC